MASDEIFLHHVSDYPSDDLHLLPSEGHGLLHDAATGEVMEMVLGDDDIEDVSDIVFGRMPVGGAGDPSEFDYLPRNEVDMAESADEEQDVFLGDDDESPAPFATPADEQFPVFKKALRHFSASSRQPKVVRIDTESSYDDFITQKAADELNRKLDDLKQTLDAHIADPNAHHHAMLEDRPAAAKPLTSEVLGAVKEIAALKAAETPKEAAAALPKVPLDLPEFAEGKVQCYKDGDNIVCSIRFAAADGTVRIATMAAKPKADEEEAARWALRAGVDPVTVLGALPDLAANACGKRLVKTVAGAALAAHRRLDVLGMAKDGTEDTSLIDGDEDDYAANEDNWGEDSRTDPLILTTPSDPGAAPLAALMHVQQLAESGDSQAKSELNKIRTAATTVTGAALAPVVAEAHRRLTAGKEAAAVQKEKQMTHAQKYAAMSIFV